MDSNDHASYAERKAVIYAIRNHDKTYLIGSIGLVINYENVLGELGFWIRKEAGARDIAQRQVWP